MVTTQRIHLLPQLVVIFVLNWLHMSNRNMPLDEFKGLLAKLAMKCQKVFKKQVA